MLNDAGKLNISWVDLLKIDIEGSEWQALPQILASAQGRIPFSQLQVCSQITRLSTD